MRRTLAALAIVALATLPALASPPTVGECEANDAGNSHLEASPIEAPAACRGNLAQSDADYFAFRVEPDQAIALNVAVQPPNQATVQLRTPSGVTQICDLGSCKVERAAEGTWKIGVIYNSGPGGNYALALVVAPGAPNTSCDVPDAANGAPGTGITPPLVCGGAIAPAGDEDWFRFNANAGAILSASMLRQPTPGSGLMTLKLRAPDGTFVACTNDAASTCSVPAAQGGAWHLVITARTPGGVGSYVVALAMADQVDPVPSTCEPGGDASPTTTNATERESNEVCTGKIRDTDDVDVFVFDVVAATGNIAAFAVTVTPLNGSSYDVSVFDAAGRHISCEDARASVCANSSATGGPWYIRVGSGGGAPGPYVLSITTVVGDPSSIQPAVENLLNSALAPVSCEPNDASGNTETPADLPWTSPNETLALCRGSVKAVAPDTGVDSYRFLVRTATATVRVVLQPESPTLDLTLSMIPPPGACASSTHVNGKCPAITSTLGRDGQPDFVDLNTVGGAKSGDWIVVVGYATGEPGGAYELGVSVQNG